MTTKMEQFPATNPNPVLSVAIDGTARYSNKAGEPLLNEWGVKVGEKLPIHIGDLVQRVIAQNSPEKMDIKVGNRTYLIVFSPLPEQELVIISGFDISDHRELGEETQQSEERLKALMDHNPSLVFMKDECGRYVYLNKSYEKQFVHSKDWYGKTDFDFWPKESAELFRANDSLVLKS
jgi:PAS domain-containing protein